MNHRLNNRKTSTGFTIVELLVVIVIIAILAAITIMAYNGIQGRSRDAQRVQDIKVITQALEAYYLDNSRYPQGSCASSCTINGSWSTTNDTGWENLKTALVPKYISSLPSDPKTMPGTNTTQLGNYGYAYFSNTAGTYCGAGNNQMYILVYQLEADSQKNTLNGTCTTSPLGPYSGKSNHRVAIGGS